MGLEWALLRTMRALFFYNFLPELRSTFTWLSCFRPLSRHLPILTKTKAGSQAQRHTVTGQKRKCQSLLSKMIDYRNDCGSDEATIEVTRFLRLRAHFMDPPR